MLYLLLALVVAICSQDCYASEGCRAPIILAKDMPASVELPIVPEHHRSKRAVITKLRIHLDYQTSFNSMENSSFIKENIVEVGKAKIEAAVKAINPLASALLVERKCLNGLYRRNTNGVIGCANGCESQTTCAGVTVPDKYFMECTTINSDGSVVKSGTSGPGASDTDLVILVASLPCPSDSTIAYAASCFLEKSLDRPILGILNLCSKHFLSTGSVQQNIAVIQHEIIHVLGFSVDRFAYFRYRNGYPRIPRNLFNFPDNGLHSTGVYDWNDKVAKTVTRSRSSTQGTYYKIMNALTLPNVVRAAQLHFNCPSLSEVDLEDFGSPGSSYSHFDEYFLNEEMMTPTVNGFQNALSEMTLAFLYDTGWYDVDFSKAEYLDYGKNKGCDLPTKGCYSYMIAANPALDPFCNTGNGNGNSLSCSMNKMFFKYCNLVQYQTLDSKYRYFSNGLFAGTNEYNEYCPVYVMNTNPSSNCEDTLNTGKSSTFYSFNNYFGQDSKCFETNSSRTGIIYGAACMKYQCNMATSQYTVTYNGTTYQCTGTNEHILTSSNDTLKCASFASVCQYTPPSKTTFQPTPEYGSIALTTTKNHPLVLTTNYIFIILSLVALFILRMV